MTMEGFKQIQETVDGDQTAVNEILESDKSTMKEPVKRVKPTANLLNYVQQNPWLLIGSATLMGSIRGNPFFMAWIGSPLM